MAGSSISMSCLLLVRVGGGSEAFVAIASFELSAGERIALDALGSSRFGNVMIALVVAVEGAVVRKSVSVHRANMQHRTQSFVDGSLACFLRRG
jgi:hypothetical protein